MANVALYTARTGLDTAQEWMNNISNNAANMKSLAFKEGFLQVSDLSYSQIKRAGVQESQDTFGRPAGVQRGSGSKVVGTTRIMTDGPKKQTNNPLDIMIQGPGYLAVNLPNGITGYTRVGALRKTSTGQLTTINGYALTDDIVITANNLNDVTIGTDGTVTVTDNSTVPPTITSTDNISLYVFPNEQGLQDIGNGISIATDASGDGTQVTPGQNNAGTIEQKALEMSNVNSVEIMTSLIEANHTYELNTKIIMAVNDMEKNTNSMYK